MLFMIVLFFYLSLKLLRGQLKNKRDKCNENMRRSFVTSLSHLFSDRVISFFPMTSRLYLCLEFSFREHLSECDLVVSRMKPSNPLLSRPVVTNTTIKSIL